MRDDPVDLRGAEAVGLERRLRGRGEVPHGRLEHVLPAHVHVVALVARARPRVNGSFEPPPGMQQRRRERAVGEDVRREDAAPASASSSLSGPTTTAPAPSPKSTQVVRSLPVEDAREQLDADHEHVLRRAGAHELVGDGQAVDEARARGADVERRAVLGADLLLHVHRGRRHRHVAADRADDDHVELIGRDAGALERRAWPRPPPCRW